MRHPASTPTPTRRPWRAPLALVAALLLVLVGCQADDQEQAQPPDEPGGELPDLDEEAFALGEQELELPDPDEHVEDGVFRGEGIILTSPEGWAFDQMAFAQGLVVATSEDGSQQLAGRAVDSDLMDEDIDFETLLEQNRQQLEATPDVDEPVELEGAEAAQQMRFMGIASPREGVPDTSALVIFAHDGDGMYGLFEYIAPADDFDEDVADLLLTGSGFDPDSEPSPPAFG